MQTDDYGLDAYVDDLRRITSAINDEGEIIAKVSPLSRRFALGKTWLREEHYKTNPEQGYETFLLHEESDHSLAVMAINWTPGHNTPVHDHGTWVVVCGVIGTETNVSYRRIDDRKRPDYAVLEVKNETIAGTGDLVCMKTGGIHAVHNQSDELSISLHTYGMNFNFTGRSQFDLETNEKKDFIVDMR